MVREADQVIIPFVHQQTPAVGDGLAQEEHRYVGKIYLRLFL